MELSLNQLQGIITTTTEKSSTISAMSKICTLLSNWYNLAEALVKAGDHDALIAINVGIDMDRNATFRDRFLALRSELG